MKWFEFNNDLVKEELNVSFVFSKIVGSEFVFSMQWPHENGIENVYLCTQPNCSIRLWDLKKFEFHLLIFTLCLFLGELTKVPKMHQAMEWKIDTKLIVKICKQLFLCDICMRTASNISQLRYLLCEQLCEGLTLINSTDDRSKIVN